MAKDLSTQNYGGGYSTDTIKMVETCFNKYDLDKNCRLDRSEFRAVLVACGLRDVDAKAIYEKVDKNNDGNVDMREFINWLYADNPEFDTAKTGEAKERMDKVQMHMKRGVMSKEEAMDDFFEFMTGLKEEYKYASKRDVVVLEKDLKTWTTKSNQTKVEKNRDVRLRDFFNTMDLNNNGKLTMSEFVGGLKSFGHDGSQEMIADIFRGIDQLKTHTRVFDRKYNQLKKEEDDMAAQGKVVYLVPACEVFEKRDMRKWNEERANAIQEEMEKEKENVQEMLAKRVEVQDELTNATVERQTLQNKMNDKKVANPAEDAADQDALMRVNKLINEKENEVKGITDSINTQRFVYTQTKHKDGMVDFNEFKKFFDKASGNA